MKRCVIFGSVDIDFPVEKMIRDSDVIFCADRGWENAVKHGIKPDFIVGDFDSVEQEALEFFLGQEQMDIHRLNPEKDDTDTEYALRFAIGRGATKITVLGGTGSRLDHVIGNVVLLGAGLEKNVSIELLDTHNKIKMVNSSLSVRKDERFGKYLSVIPITGKVDGVTITGVKYPLDNYDMHGFNTLGISNEIVDDEAAITVRNGIVLVIESRD